MQKTNRLRCLVCGFHHEGPDDRHHCRNCYADRFYLRPARQAGVSPLSDGPAAAASSPRA
jgi:hypothetical protein